jgi:predicted ATPase/DNA-binding SARP family transcriptional activator
MDERCRIRLFGGLQAESADRVVARFPTRKTGALLAYLAYFPHRSHSREALIDLLWPESAPQAARQSLSQSLHVLRDLLECLGEPPVLLVERASVRLNSAAVTTDVAAFEAALQAAARVPSSVERAQYLTEAVELCRGPLLAGYSEVWILGEQERLAELYFQALGQLTPLLEAAGERERALEHARRGISMDPLREEGHHEVIRLLLASGEAGAALRQYRQLERLLERELRTTPSPATRALARRLPACADEGEPVAARDQAPCGVEMVAAGEDSVGWLPQPITRFFGRTAECARLAEILRAPGTRLVTLTGPGGSGKTRLALEVAGRLVEARQGAVWCVPLAELVDPRLVVDAVRDAMRLPRSPGVEALEQVVTALAHRPSMLLLDNFEHLLDKGALLLSTLLRRAPTLTCLVTSRQRLDVAGEREFPVLPLPVPDEGDGPVALACCDSVQLFVDRAQAVRPEFRVTPANAAAVAAVCHRLEGIPLALELAAARAAVLTPAQMLEHLERRLDFLVGQKRDAPARHRTLRAAIDWSFRLLSPEQQRFFLQLAVFQGGWTLEAAAAVCDQGPALDRLEQLRECSLVLAQHSCGEVRFRILETLREYAQARWTPEERSAVEQRHAEYFRALAEQAEPELHGPDAQAWLDRLEREHDNLRAALAWATVHREATVGLRLGGALWEFWEVRGYPTEGRERLAALLAPQGAAGRTAQRAKALHGAGALALDQSDYAAARELLAESLAIWRELGAGTEIAATLHLLADAAFYAGDWETARALYEESLAIRRELGEKHGIARSLESLGNLTRRLNEPEKVRALYAESLAIRRDLGNKLEIAASLCDLGNAALDRGDYAAARSLHQESLTLLEEAGDRDGIGSALQNLGTVAYEVGDLGASRRFYEESLAIRRELGNRRCLAMVLNYLGDVAWRQGDEDSAAALYDESWEIRQAIGDREGISKLLQSQARLAAGKTHYERARALYKQCLELRRVLGDRRSIAACLEGLAAVCAGQEDSLGAARLFAAAGAVRDAIGVPLPSVERGDYDRHVAALRARLGAEAFAAAWAAGRALTMQQALTEATWEMSRPDDAPEEGSGTRNGREVAD